MAGARVTLTKLGGVPVASTVTDEDGFYRINHKHTGKPTVYSVSITTPQGLIQTKAVSLKPNHYLQVDFLAP